MKIVNEPRYIALDETVFTNKDECISYEKNLLKEHDNVMQAVMVLKNFCTGRGCTGCIFHSDVKIVNTYCKLKQTAPHLWHTIFPQQSYVENENDY